MTEPVPFDDDQAIRRAHRQLGVFERWALGRDAIFGRTAHTTRRAALLAWRARRDLQQLPWSVAVVALFWLGLYIVWARMDSVGAGTWLIFPFAWAAVLLLFQRPRLRAAALRNAQLVEERTGVAQPKPPGGSNNVRWVLLAVALVASVPLGLGLDRLAGPEIERLSLRWGGPVEADEAAERACREAAPHWESIFSPDVSVAERASYLPSFLVHAEASDTAGFSVAARRLFTMTMGATSDQRRFDLAVDRIAEVCGFAVPDYPARTQG